MNPGLLGNMFGGIIIYTGIHAVSGLIGGILGMVIIRGMESRGLTGGN
ncbi:hypothetical protein ACFL0D_01350 [Thermoproteota archaeon]